MRIKNSIICVLNIIIFSTIKIINITNSIICVMNIIIFIIIQSINIENIIIFIIIQSINIENIIIYVNLCYKYFYFSYNSKYSYQRYYYLC
jgi:hypothetical protein